MYCCGGVAVQLRLLSQCIDLALLNIGPRVRGIDTPILSRFSLRTKKYGLAKEMPLNNIYPLSCCKVPAFPDCDSGPVKAIRSYLVAFQNHAI